MWSDWRKSSRSNGGGNCVELSWRKSSRSNGGGACVELARSAGAVRVRDSKNSAGPVLGFSAGAAASFFASLKRG